jgi:hypothetical protein
MHQLQQHFLLQLLKVPIFDLAFLTDWSGFC